MKNTPHILCISLSPVLDRYLTVDGFEVGKIGRAIQVVERAGGKTINMARAIRQVGGHPVVVAPLGGHTGTAIIDAARLEGIELVATHTVSRTRYYTATWDSTREVFTGLAEPLSDMSTKEWGSFIGSVTQQIKGTTSFDAAVVSGRMPPGVPVEEVTALVRLITSQGIPCYVDSYGATLVSMIVAKPNGVKINNIEASEYLGMPVNSIQEAAEACRQLNAQGIETSVITMGVHGAVGTANSACYHVTIPDLGPWPVGSGDSFFGALVVKLAQKESWLNTLIAAAAAGTANAHRLIAGLLDIERFENGQKEAQCVHLECTWGTALSG